MTTLPGVGESVPAARRFVLHALTELGAPGATDDALTLTSELATNAVLHAHSEFTISVTRTGGTIRIRVHDLSAVLPRPRNYATDSTTGRGLRLIATIASAWGVESDGDGKAIWFDLPVDGNRDVAAWDDETDVEALLASFEDGAASDTPAAGLAMAA